MEEGSFVSVLSAVIVLGVLSSVSSAGAVTYSGWGIAQLIETDNSGSATFPQVAMDSNGNAFVVWYQSDGTLDHIWSNRFVVGAGWETAQRVESSPELAAGPHVAMDSYGNAIAVWNRFDGARWNVWSNRYVSGAGWGAAQLIETDDSGSACTSQVASDSAGNATAVWYQSDGVRFNIWSNRYIVGAGWMTAQLIESDDSGDASEPRVATDSLGNAVAVWSQSDGIRSNIWSNRYVTGVGWGSPQLIETDNAGGASAPELAVDSSGNAVAAWWQFDGIRSNIWSNRFVVGIGWGTAQLIETDSSGTASGPHVAVDRSGNAVAVWYQSDGVRNSIWSNRYVVGTGWGAAQLIETDNSDAFNPRVAVDNSGNAVSVWCQYDGTRYNILSNRFVVGTGWGTAKLIESDNSGDAYWPEVAAGSSGNAVVVWSQSDGARISIWSNRFVVPDTTPPSLSLTSPSQGLTTETSVVTVTGITEPGVTLKINGVLVAVGPDGSFSCELALVEGSNTILANATDAGGNSVTVSRTVTYLNPVPNLREELNATHDDLEDVKSQSLLLIALFAVFAVLAVVMSVMYFSLRKKTVGKGGNVDKRLPPPPQS